jgi:hypothetical protein
MHYIHSLKVILYVLSNCAHETKLHAVKFSTSKVVSTLKKFEILEHLIFWVFRLGKFNPYEEVNLSGTWGGLEWRLQSDLFGKDLP